MRRLDHRLISSPLSPSGVSSPAGLQSMLFQAAGRKLMPILDRELSERAFRRFRAVLNVLIGIALILLAGALFDHQNLEVDLTSGVAGVIGVYCIVRGIVLFWVE
jgi:undecaprenyl pyrophosphate phosphatase UppP